MTAQSYSSNGRRCGINHACPVSLVEIVDMENGD